MADVYIDPTKLRPLPRTVIPEIISPEMMAAPPSFPALPWFIMLICLVSMPLCFSIVMLDSYGHQTCDKEVVLYLQGQAICSCCYVVIVGIPMWKRINWVGNLKDAISESPELAVYTVSTSLWWFEFVWTIFGVRNAVEASACSNGLKYASETLAWYMMCLGVWLDLAFHIGIPAMLHLYSGQPAADILPPGVGCVSVPSLLSTDHDHGSQTCCPSAICYPQVHRATRCASTHATQAEEATPVTRMPTLQTRYDCRRPQDVPCLWGLCASTRVLHSEAQRRHGQGQGREREARKGRDENNLMGHFI